MLKLIPIREAAIGEAVILADGRFAEIVKPLSEHSTDPYCKVYGLPPGAGAGAMFTTTSFDMVPYFHFSVPSYYLVLAHR